MQDAHGNDVFYCNAATDIITAAKRNLSAIAHSVTEHVGFL